MIELPYQRARRPEQKEKRREHLLQITRSLLTDRPDVAAFGLNELARQTGMTKSNIYRYFDSRESILLALLQEEWAIWTSEVKNALGERGQPVSLDTLAKLTANRTASRPLLGHLMSVLPSIIERNVSIEDIRSFKVQSLDMIHQIAKFMNQYAPILSVAEYEEFSHRAIIMVTGLWPLSNPSQAALDAITVPGLEPFRYDFELDLARGLTLVLRGLHYEQLNYKQK